MPGRVQSSVCDGPKLHHRQTDVVNLYIRYINSLRACVMELGCASPADRARLGKNGIRKMGFGKPRFEKTGLGKTGFGKNGIRKTGFEKNGIRPSSQSGSARQKLDHLCLCSTVATPELQVHVCMPRVDLPDLFLFVAKMAIICRKMWKKWAIL